MQNYSLLLTLGVGSLIAFIAFFVFYRVLKWQGKMSALATATLMQLLYVPLAVTHWAGLDVFAIHFAIYSMIPYGLGIIKGVHEERVQYGEVSEDDKRVHWAPASIVTFFIALAIVDSVIISFATKGLNGSLAALVLPESTSNKEGKVTFSHFTGTVSNNFHDKELEFNQYVEQLKKQKQRGWQIKGGWQDKVVLNEPANFTLTILDKAGNPLTGANTSIDFYRASDMSKDQHYVLAEKQPGQYGSDMTLQSPGCWQLRIIVNKNDNLHEVKGNTEVAERVDGKLIDRLCIDDDRA